jgi:DNA polymerase (family 10)
MGRGPVSARNVEIANIFDDTADLLEIESENPFRIHAYRNAARLLRGLKQEAADMLAAGKDLAELPGIGKDLASKIGEVVESGSMELLRRLHRQLPHSIIELLRVPGLGPKRAKLLHERLGIRRWPSCARPRRPANCNACLALARGPRQRSGTRRQRSSRRAAPHICGSNTAAEALIPYLRSAPGVKQVVLAGSYRRARETVGDVDIRYALFPFFVAPIHAAADTDRAGGGFHRVVSGGYASLSQALRKRLAPTW